MRWPWIAIALGACGKAGDRGDPPRADPWAGPATRPPTDAAPPIDLAPDAPPDAHEAPFARSPVYELRALGLALDDVSDDATAQWTAREARRSADVPADELPPDEPMPPATEHAIAALVTWDQAGAPMSLGCASPDLGALVPLIAVTKAALQATPRADAPPLHAILRASQALRAPGADPLAAAVGVSLATAIARWAYAHHLRPESVIAGGPTAADARAGALAAADCQLASIVKVRLAIGEPDGRETIRGARQELGLPATDADVDAEPGQLEAFLRATRDLIEHASDDRLAREIDARTDAAQADTHSVLVRQLGAPYPSRTVLRAFAAYRAAFAGERPAGADAP